jgi:hypothetical protein
MPGAADAREEFANEPCSAALRVALRLRMCSTSPVSGRTAMIG